MERACARCGVRRGLAARWDSDKDHLYTVPPPPLSSPLLQPPSAPGVNSTQGSQSTSTSSSSHWYLNWGLYVGATCGSLLVTVCCVCVLFRARCRTPGQVDDGLVFTRPWSTPNNNHARESDTEQHGYQHRIQSSQAVDTGLVSNRPRRTSDTPKASADTYCTPSAVCNSWGVLPEASLAEHMSSRSVSLRSRSDSWQAQFSWLQEAELDAYDGSRCGESPDTPSAVLSAASRKVFGSPFVERSSSHWRQARVQKSEGPISWL